MINVILPTYNEAENILIMLDMLKHIFDKMRVAYKIVIVDDNSQDNTSSIVKNSGHDHILVIDRAGKLGLGSAYIESLQHCNYPYTIVMDSDLQHDPFNIPKMFSLATAENYDIVTATRYYKTGKVCNWPFIRKLNSIGTNTFARYVLGLKCSDLTGSFRIYKTSLLRELMPKIICKGFGFQMEIISRAELMGKRIAEVPITFYDRVAGESKMCLKELGTFIKTVVMLYFLI